MASDPSAYDVLLVDDEPVIRDLLVSLLGEDGLSTQEAQDGIDGLEKLREMLPNVIISDLLMPRMSGLEFISVVRRRFPSIPVIVFSGSIQVDFPAEAMPDVWFEKDVRHIPDLLKAVHDLVRKTPDRPNLPQVISTPVLARREGRVHFVLTCSQCLRLFRVTATPEIQTGEQTATCVYCEAHVPFLIESEESPSETARTRGTTK